MAVTPTELSKRTTTSELVDTGDADLLDAWAKDRYGDALATLIERYSRLVLSVCRRRCRSADDVEDAFQSTFLHLARNASKIRRPECLPGWLHTVAQRAANATLTRQVSDEPLEEPMANQEDPLEHIARRHESMVLDEELGTLPEHYRAAIVMHVYEGWTFDRLAEHFETTLGAIRGRVQRGKRMLAHRLRRRGIVPVVAFAAASATMASASKTAAASQLLVDAVLGGTLPESPIHPAHFEPLLQTGSKVMTPWSLAAGITAAGTLSIAMFLPSPSDGTRESDVVSIGAAGDSSGEFLAQVGVPTAANTQTRPSETSVNQPRPTQQFVPQTQPGAANFNRLQPMAQSQSSAPQPGFPQNQMNMVPTTVMSSNGTPTTTFRPFHTVTPPGATVAVTGQTAARIRAVLDQPTKVEIKTNLSSLDAAMESLLGIPVILNERAVAFGKLQSSRTISYESQGEPLRTALRRMLRPLGLKATVEEDALVITADHHELALQGIGTDQWINVDDEMMRRVTRLFDQLISFQCAETPLHDAVKHLSKIIDSTIVIDQRALEEVGLSRDTPVSIEMTDISARSLFNLMMKDLDLTVTISNDVVTITTRESADASLLNRIYWLEGIGADGDYGGLMAMIQSTIEPDSWEQLGGSSTIVSAGTKRPAIVVSSTYNNHLQIEKLFETLRTNSFGARNQTTERVVVPKAVSQSGGFM
ncbi:MAG: sigma-70 family RNA polymerase sigma factor [Planctomycetota bacterium]